MDWIKGKLKPESPHIENGKIPNGFRLKISQLNQSVDINKHGDFPIGMWSLVDFFFKMKTVQKSCLGEGPLHSLHHTMKRLINVLGC